MTAQDRDARPFQRLGEVGADRLHQLIGMVSDLLPLKAHRRGVDAETRQMLIIGQFTHLAAGRQQCLGGHTPPVHAGAAHVTRFNDRGLEAMLRSMLRSIETAVAGADDDDVEIETGVAHPDCCDVVAVIVALRRSRSRGTAAAATFRDSTRSLWGRVTAWVQQA